MTTTTDNLPGSVRESAERELADLLERRERVRAKLGEAEVREADLARLVDPRGPLPPGPPVPDTPGDSPHGQPQRPEPAPYVYLLAKMCTLYVQYHVQ